MDINQTLYYFNCSGYAIFLIFQIALLLVFLLYLQSYKNTLLLYMLIDNTRIYWFCRTVLAKLFRPNHVFHTVLKNSFRIYAYKGFVKCSQLYRSSIFRFYHKPNFLVVQSTRTPKESIGAASPYQLCKSLVYLKCTKFEINTYIFENQNLSYSHRWHETSKGG